MDDDFGHWLAGFIAGEGCFIIGKYTSGSYQCRLEIRQRADNRQILHEIVEQTGIGNVAGHPANQHSGRNNNPSASWIVTGVACLEVIHLLDRYPLRANKVRDYEIWREAVAWHAGNIKRGRYHNNDWGPMEDFKNRLSSVRAFAT